MKNEIQISKARIEVVDALRGFAIMAIMLLHSIEHFNFYVFPDSKLQPEWLTKLDGHIWDTLFFLFGGKGYAIFAILFGFTFHLMMKKQKDKGIDFGYRFLWRMFLLACFALFNGAFFPGEVLLLYAIVGVFLFFVRNVKTYALLIIALILLTQPIEWGRFFIWLGDTNFTIPAKTSYKYWGLLKEGQMGESFFNLIKTNTLYGHKASLLWAFEVGRIIQTAGLFVLGFWLGKMNKFIDSKKNTRFWFIVLAASIILFIPLLVMENYFKAAFDTAILKRTVVTAIDMYGNIAFTFVLISSFILLYKTPIFRKLSAGLKCCGRMSLSSYILQSIIGGFVFYGYGLGIGPHVRHTVSLGIGIGLFVILLIFCKLWLNRFKQGPFEMLWHYLTWIRIKN